MAYAQEDEYEEWRKKQQKEYNEYLNEQDKAFLKFLKKKWKNVEVESEMGSPVDDKPADIPTVGSLDIEPGATNAANRRGDRTVDDDPAPESEPLEEREADREVDPEPSQEEIAESEDERRVDTNPDRDRPERPAEEESSRATAKASLSFFGTETAVPYRSSLVPSMKGSPGKKPIRSFWRTMAEQKYDATLDAVEATRTDLGLSDWGYYVYVRDLANQLYREKGYSEGSNSATLWTWFVMMKSGYSVRVGYRGQDIFLLLPVDTQIFNRPQMYLDDQRYYLMVENSSGGSLRTYEGQHETADQVLELDERVLPKIEGETRNRTASFSYGDKRYNIDYTYDAAVLEYLRAYPNVELSVLFRSGASPAATSSLRSALESHLEGKSSRDALNILLRFSQFATDYKRDQDNFGEERFLFPEETLAASASDCEDRAVLFAYLARTLLDRRLVGLEWPTHIATAVKVGNGLEANSDDRTLTVEGDTYIMADPTYIGSSIGMEMPIVEGKKPDIIQFEQ